MVYYEDGKLKGISGILLLMINKGICVICQKILNVLFFFFIMKVGFDGMYMKKGNYICYDSD